MLPESSVALEADGGRWSSGRLVRWLASPSARRRAVMLTPACSPQPGPTGAAVLRRITRTQVAFLERTYRERGLAAEQAARHTRITYALCFGIGQLRRAWPRGLPGSEVDAYVDLAVRALLDAAGVPPRDADEAIKAAGRDQA